MPDEARYEMFGAIEAVAEKFPDPDAAIDKVLEVAAHMQFIQSVGFQDGDGISQAWTNSDCRRACEKLIDRLRETIDSIPPTRF